MGEEAEGGGDQKDDHSGVLFYKKPKEMKTWYLYISLPSLIIFQSLKACPRFA